MQNHEQAIQNYLSHGGEVHRVPTGRRVIRRAEMRERLHGEFKGQVDAS